MIVTRQELGMLALTCIAALCIALASLFSPTKAQAFPFGGQVLLMHQCINDVTYVMLGPPKPGPYIWSASTQTYDYGPPSHTGQWLLGLAGAPDICVVSTGFFPIIWPGTHIDMLGSSQ